MEIVWAQQTVLDNPRAGGMILELPVDVTSVSFDDDWNVLVAFRHHGIQWVPFIMTRYSRLIN